MALINCPECNKEISDKSIICIHCGYFFSQKEEEKKYLAVVCPTCGSSFVDYGNSNIQNRKIFEDLWLTKPCSRCGDQCVEYIVTNPPSISKIEEYFNYYNDLVGGTINKELYMKWQNKIEEDINKARIINNSKPTNPTCPYCNSISTRKISTLSRAFSTGLFGLGSSKVGKQWHCNKCGSDF